MESESSGYDNLASMLQDGSSKPCNLPLQFLRNITNNFSDELLLGEGGFGTVYKGVLPNGETIAVKKLNSSMPGVKDRQFQNEAYHLMKLNHPNVVLLVGWCSETENVYTNYNGKYICAEKPERLLCLEYMPNGNLREYLKDEASRLGWDICYKIIEGICYGLHYLHEEWQQNTPIIHMDLKPANILLDNNMVPKIADFGLSRLFSEEKTRTCTISRDGTLGYMAPEYINKGLITTKSDIFSLGVIIIEIVTGHRDYPDETGISPQEFIELVLNNWRNRLQNSMGYTTLEIYYQQIRRCIQIGLVCVKLDRSKRPTTGQIIKMLHGSESADANGKKEVNQHWATTSEVASNFSSSSLGKEGQSRKRHIKIDPNCEERHMPESQHKRSTSQKEHPVGSPLMYQQYGWEDVLWDPIDLQDLQYASQDIDDYFDWDLSMHMVAVPEASGLVVNGGHAHPSPHPVGLGDAGHLVATGTESMEIQHLGKAPGKASSSLEVNVDLNLPEPRAACINSPTTTDKEIMDAQR